MPDNWECEDAVGKHFTLTAAEKLAIQEYVAAGKPLSSPGIYGAVGNGTTDDTGAINNWIGGGGLKFLANGDYLMSGSATAFSRPTVILADNAKESGTELPLISVGKEGFKTLPKNYVFIQQDTSDRSDSTTVHIQRIVDTDDGHTNPKGLRVYLQKNHSNDSTEWAISGEIDNYSTVASSGETAVSGVARKYGTASIFGGHFQSSDMIKVAAATDVTPTIGVESNIQAIGLDHPTANGNVGNRRVYDIIARTNEDVSGWDTATNNYGAAEIGVGIIIRSDNLTDGYFRYGLVIDDVTQKPGNTNNITTGALIQTSGAIGVAIKGANTTAALQIAPATRGAHGLLIASADYTSGAIGVDSGAWITMSDDDTKKIRYNAGTDGIELWSGASNRVYFRMNASPAMFISSTQVVGARDTGWTAMTGTPDESTSYATGSVTLPQLAGRVMALQTALTTHGLIGA
jgi:hypothetical protein